jgi:creatinine amidohydrolase
MSELGTLAWVDVEHLLARTDLGLVPLGAVEVYGPHMPQGTDGIVAVELCRRLAERVPALVTPLIPVGDSASLASFPGTLAVRPSSLIAYVEDVVRSLLGFGLRRILFINGHAGNVQPIDTICRDLSKDGCRLAQIDIWRFIQTFTRDLLDSQDWTFGHAGEAMTSVMLYLHPEWVQMDRACRGGPELADLPLGVSYPRRYRDLAPNGLLGDATLATAEKGREIIQRATAELVKFVGSPEFSIQS